MPLRNLQKSYKMKNNYCIFAIKTDHGGEFQNERFDKFCEKFGIKHLFQLLKLHNKMEWCR